MKQGWSVSETKGVKRAIVELNSRCSRKSQIQGIILNRTSQESYRNELREKWAVESIKVRVGKWLWGTVMQNEGCLYPFSFSVAANGGKRRNFLIYRGWSMKEHCKSNVSVVVAIVTPFVPLQHNDNFSFLFSGDRGAR